MQRYWSYRVPGRVVQRAVLLVEVVLSGLMAAETISVTSADRPQPLASTSEA